MCSDGSDWALPQPGFPIRKSSDHSSVDSSPRLIAASYVLHRLLVPRHPPCALTNLTTKMLMLASTMQFSRYGRDSVRSPGHNISIASSDVVPRRTGPRSEARVFRALRTQQCAVHRLRHRYRSTPARGSTRKPVSYRCTMSMFHPLSPRVRHSRTVEAWTHEAPDAP